MVKNATATALPHDWETVPLGEHYHFQNGVNADARAYGRGVPFANVLEVITRTHLQVSDIPGRVTLGRETVTTYAVRRGDVLFNRTSETQEEVGLASVYSDDATAVFGGFVIRGRPKSDAFDPAFSGYAFRAPYVRGQIVSKGQGAVRANIGQSDLKTVLVPRPQPQEQQAIAAALSDADALIEGLERLIAKKRAIKQGAMQELFSGRRRLAGFSEEWTIKPLGDLARMKSGEGITSKNINNFSPFPCYGGNGLRGYAARYTHDGRYALIGRVGALCGNLNIVDGRFFASEHAIVVTPMNDVSVDWLALALDQLQLNRFSEASAQPVLTVSKLEKLEIGVPPSKDEQVAIASIIFDLTADLEALDVRLAKVRQIKQGMMQELLTGRVRLV